MLLYTCMLTAWQVYVYLWLPLSLCWFVCYNISSTLAWSVSMSVGENQEFLQWSVSDKPAFLQWSVGDKPCIPAVVCWWQTRHSCSGLLVTNQTFQQWTAGDKPDIPAVVCWWQTRNSCSGLLVTNQAFLQWSVGDKPGIPAVVCWWQTRHFCSGLLVTNQAFLQWSVSDKPAFLQWSVGDKPDLPAVVCWWQTSLPTVGLLVTNQPSYSGLLVTNQAFLQWSVGDKPVIPAVDNLNLINCIICISITCRTSIFNHMTTDLLCPLNIMTVSKNIAKLSQGFWRLSWRYYWHCFSIVYLVNIRPWYFASSNSLIDIERSKYIFLIIFLHYNYQE
jgi:hypothetical protein